MESTGRVPVWTLGDRLMKARRDAGMSQEEMAETLLVSRNTVVGWERDQHRPPRRKLAAWALRTGVDLVWITSDDGDIAGAGGRSTGWLHRHRAVAMAGWLPRRLRHTREAEHQPLHYAAALDLLAPPVLSHAVVSIPRPRGATDPIPMKSRRPA